jgi:THAP domain
VCTFVYVLTVMGKRCVVSGCKRSVTTKDKPLFYTIPAARSRGDPFDIEISVKRRQCWISRLGLDNQSVTTYTLICDAHFITGLSNQFKIGLTVFQCVIEH